MSVVKKLIFFDSVIADELKILSKTFNITEKEVIDRVLDFYFDHTDYIITQKILKDVSFAKEQVHDYE